MERAQAFSTAVAGVSASRWSVRAGQPEPSGGTVASARRGWSIRRGTSP
jgi:hypothetical protein